MNDHTSSQVSINCQYLRQYLVQGYLLIWLDHNIDETNEEYQNNLKLFKNVDNTINIFTDPKECVDFFTEINNIKTFLIINNILGEEIIPLIHDLPQLDQIYIFSSTNSLSDQEWIKEWPKIQSIHSEITSLCDTLKMTIRQTNQNSIVTSVISPNESKNPNELEATFMYSQIFKDILLKMKYNENSVEEFIAFCRNKNLGSMKNIDSFEKEYHNKSSIWWYTWPGFIFSTLNYGLRTLETDIIIKMGFFIQNLHSQIQQLYNEQRDSLGKESFNLYRGQGLSKEQFEKIVKAKGSLISFNNFLSTSKSQEVSSTFAFCASTVPDTIGVLFIISIDPSVSSTPFACIQKHSCLKDEEEVLFSMHTIFRIGNIKECDNYDQVYEIELHLTEDNDQDLRILTDWLSKDIEDEIGWKKLCNLLIKIGQLQKAEEFYNTLIEQTLNVEDLIHYYGQLAYIKFKQDDKALMMLYHIKIRELEKRTSSNNSDFNSKIIATNMDFSEDNKSVAFHDSNVTLDFEAILKCDVMQMEEVGEKQASENAFLFYEKALADFERNLCSTTVYNHVDPVDNDLKQTCPLLWFQRKILEIRQKYLHPTHPDIARSYGVVASLYSNREDHYQARSFYQKSIDIHEKILPSNHPLLACLYHNIGMTYKGTGEYSQVLFFVKKSLEIAEKVLPPDHPDLISIYCNIAIIYEQLKDYSNAIVNYKNLLVIHQQQLPSNDLKLIDDHVKIASLYNELNDYTNAILFYEKALDIIEKYYPSEYATLFTYYDKVARLYEKNKNYCQSVVFYEKTLEISRQIFPSNDINLAICHSNVGIAYAAVGECTEALSYLEHALKMMKISDPDNESRWKRLQDDINRLKEILDQSE